MINPVALEKNSIQLFGQDLSVLEGAIKNKNAEQAIVFLTRSPQSANQPLPNGEMPFHFAIRQENFEFIKDLLASGIPFSDLKDHQGLTYVDHAFLTGNKEIISAVLGHKIGTSFHGAKNKVLSSSDVRLIDGLSQDVKKLKGLVSGLPGHRAAAGGALDEVKKSFKAGEKDRIDSLGMTQLHYAVLKGQAEVVDWLIGQGCQMDVLTSDRKSLLHLAAIGGNSEMIERLIATKAFDLNAVDASGFSPLHYAVAVENSKGAQSLVGAGADPLSGQVLSPLDVMVHLAKTGAKDPLKLDNSQWLLFATIIVPWISSYFGGSSWVDVAQLMSILQFAIVGCQSIHSVKSAAVFLGMSLFSRFPVYGFLNQMCMSALVAKRAIQGLSACWRNLSLELYRPIRNAIVYSVCGIDAANRCKNAFVSCRDELIRLKTESNPKERPSRRMKNEEFHKAYLDESARLKKEREVKAEQLELRSKGMSLSELAAEQDKLFAPQEELDRKYFESLEFEQFVESLRNMFGTKNHQEVFSDELESEFEPSIPCTRECLLDERVDPGKYLNHARAVFGLEFGYTKPKLEKSFRELAKLYHPDRQIEASSEQHKIMIKITNGYDLLKSQLKNFF